MREIKFRCWGFDRATQEEPKMFEWDYIKREFDMYQDDEKCILMQFTGLKDKNGQEIYEGDILGRESYTNWVVGWKAPSFIIYNITNPDSQYTIWNIDIEEREVIGNIYENEDLLRNVT